MYRLHYILHNYNVYISVFYVYNHTYVYRVYVVTSSTSGDQNLGRWHLTLETCKEIEQTSFWWEGYVYIYICIHIHKIIYKIKYKIKYKKIIYKKSKIKSYIKSYIYIYTNTAIASFLLPLAMSIHGARDFPPKTLRPSLGDHGAQCHLGFWKKRMFHHQKNWMMRIHQHTHTYRYIDREIEIDR